MFYIYMLSLSCLQLLMCCPACSRFLEMHPPAPWRRNSLTCCSLPPRSRALWWPRLDEELLTNLQVNPPVHTLCKSVALINSSHRQPILKDKFLVDTSFFSLSSTGDGLLCDQRLMSGETETLTWPPWLFICFSAASWQPCYWVLDCLSYLMLPYLLQVICSELQSFLSCEMFLSIYYPNTSA